MKKKICVSDVEVTCPHCGYGADGWGYTEDGIYNCDECGEEFELTIVSDGDEIEYYTEVEE